MWGWTGRRHLLLRRYIRGQKRRKSCTEKIAPNTTRVPLFQEKKKRNGIGAEKCLPSGPALCSKGRILDFLLHRYFASVVSMEPASGGTPSKHRISVSLPSPALKLNATVVENRGWMFGSNLYRKVTTALWLLFLLLF